MPHSLATNNYVNVTDLQVRMSGHIFCDRYANDEWDEHSRNWWQRKTALNDLHDQHSDTLAHQCQHPDNEVPRLVDGSVAFAVGALGHKQIRTRLLMGDLD